MTIQQDKWISFDEDPHTLGELTSKDLDHVEVKFDNGEVVKYLDKWPFAVATHYRILKDELNLL